jgi:hypothetical protein
MKSAPGLAMVLIALTASTAFPAPAPPGSTEASRGKETSSRETEVSILSIIPAQGETGSSVTLYGNGFTSGTTAYLGTARVATTVVGPRQLEFEIPSVPPGLYALYVQREDGALSRTYTFSILAPKPAAVSLSTDSVYACASGTDRDVTVSGRNFVQGSRVLFDGAAVRTVYNSPESVMFTVPGLQGGLHQIQVKNPDDSVSGSLALFINPKPEIRSVRQGDDRVSDYDLVIEGINFQQGSTVVVDGRRLTGGVYIDRDRILYMDCTKIVYERHPYDTTAKTIRIQIVNPGGEESAVIQVNTP